MEKDLIKLIAFYLPQFYINELNDRIWGEGFTEWTNVAQARPNFKGHYQPHIPGALGFYDLSNPKTIAKQIKLAKSFGISGFCFYYYWFDGKRALEVPLDLFLKEKSYDFPFCICWANENWSKKWDGGNNEVILFQTYGDNFEHNFISSLKDILLDSRYIRKNGKPVVLIYRPALFKNPSLSVTKMREAAKLEGLGELYLLAIDFYTGEKKVEEWGFDGIVEFPPHQFYDEELIVEHFPGEQLNASFKGHLIDYRKVILRAIHKWRNVSKFPRYRGVAPSWDNTARRKNTPLTLCYSTPSLFYLWLKYALSYSKQHKLEYVFINAWNEWGEGCHLEPDRQHGYEYLEAVKKSLTTYEEKGLKEEAFICESIIKDAISNTRDSSNMESSSETPYHEVITVKEFIKSRLFLYPSLYKFIRQLYHGLTFKK